MEPYLRPNLEHVFERHARGSQLALEQHDDIGIVFLNLLRRARSILRLDVGLKSSNGFVDVRNILLDDERQFLRMENMRQERQLAPPAHPRSQSPNANI